MAHSERRHAMTLHSAVSLEAAARSNGARLDPVLELFDYLKDVLFWIKDRRGVFRFTF